MGLPLYAASTGHAVLNVRTLSPVPLLPHNSSHHVFSDYQLALYLIGS
jgi:hypothetical protein